MLWMPCRYNTFDGRLLWFDGVEGKRGLTLTGFFFGGGGRGWQREREPHSHKQSESPEDWAELNGDNNGKTRSQITNGNATKRN